MEKYPVSGFLFYTKKNLVIQCKWVHNSGIHVIILFTITCGINSMWVTVVISMKNVFVMRIRFVVKLKTVSRLASGLETVLSTLML